MPLRKKIRVNTTPTITFYVLHLPVLLLLLGIFALSAFITSKVAKKPLAESSDSQELSYVLGDDSEDEDEDEDKDEDRDDDRDEEDKDRDETEDTDDHDDEDESEDEDNNKNKSRETIQNSDGTYSIVKTETEGNKVKIESKTYNSDGKLIKEEKHEGNEEGFESETEDSTGNKLKVRIQSKEALIKSEGVDGLKNFPLFLNDDGTVYVQTPKGEVQLGVMPQAIIDKAQVSDDSVEVEEIEIEAEDDDDTLEFKVKTKKETKLFGLFKIEIPSTVYYDVQTGEQVRSEQTFVNKLLDFLSF